MYYFCLFLCLDLSASFAAQPHVGWSPKPRLDTLPSLPYNEADSGEMHSYWFVEAFQPCRFSSFPFSGLSSRGECVVALWASKPRKNNEAYSL